MTGIKRRLLLNYLLTIVIVLLILEGIFIYFIRSYYYDNLKNNMKNRITVTSGFVNKYLTDDTYENLRKIVEDYPEKDYFEFQVIDDRGNIVLSSSGFLPDEKIETSDYVNALRGETSEWLGINEATHEKIMAVSTPIKVDDFLIGVIRCVTSIESIESAIKNIIAISIFAISIIIVFVFLLTLILSKSIIDPINEINYIARKMAKGKFSERIKKHYNDEIGELAETLNYMASEISKVDQMKNDFISAISHELRTPLTAICGWSETIITGNLENKEEMKKGLLVISKESQRLSQMVEELLDFSRLESGRLQLMPIKIDIQRELSEIVNIYRGRAKRENKEIIYNKKEDIPYIFADKNRIRQVFVNILDNAVKFSDPGTIIIVDINADDEKVNINVKDQGVGISSEDLPRVKDKFYIGKSSRSGSGIGLGISNEIIELHHGRLEIDSKQGQGTNVKIILPINNKCK